MFLSAIRGCIGAYPLRFLAIVLAVYCLVCLVACSGPGTRVAPADAEAARVAQAVSNSRAGIEAAKIELGPAVDARVSQTLDGASEYALAAAGKTAIPAPAMAPAAIAANPDAYHKAAVSTRQHADGTWLWVAIGGTLTALLPIGAMLLKDFGGPVGSLAANIALPLANAGWHAFAPQVAKDADAEAHEVNGHAKSLIGAVDALDPTVLAGLPAPVKAALDNIRAAQA